MLMLWLVLYLSIALMDLAADAAICFACERRFRWAPALGAALFWPVTMPISIYAAHHATRNFPRW